MGKLTVAVGLASRAGRRPDNQDFCAALLGTPPQRATHGVVAVLADGVSGAAAGRVAAELACREFIEAYYLQPYTLGVAACASRAMAGYARWLHAMGSSDPAMLGAATTFAALVLRGRQAHALHAGDSRAWHFRDGVLSRLTEDHTLPQPDLRHVLRRGLGLENTVRLDHRVEPLAVHDRLLLTSDGVHGSLSERTLARLLELRGSAEHDAEAIVLAALQAGSMDNASAVVLDVVALPDPDQDGVAATAAGLPVLPPPKPGDTVDEFTIGRQIANGRYSRLFVATNRQGDTCALKFPKPSQLSARGARLAFVREVVVGSLVQSPYVAEVLALPPERQSQLYVAMPFYAGETLEARLARGPMPLVAGLTVAAGITRGLIALHRRGIIHRDVKPDNVMLPAAGPPRLLDLGVARVPRLEEFPDQEIPGTPSFMAPELYQGNRGDEATDQFALGALFYRLFTGRYPFGEIEPFSRPKFDRPADPEKLRPDLPAWLAMVLARMVAPRPQDRFGDLVEVLAELEGGATRGVPHADRRALLARHPVAFWQGVSALLALALVLALALR